MLLIILFVSKKSFCQGMSLQGTFVKIKMQYCTGDLLIRHWACSLGTKITLQKFPAKFTAKLYANVTTSKLKVLK